MPVESTFAHVFALPLSVTAVFVLHYITVDTFAVGAARTPYKLMYPFTTETIAAEKLQPFIRALRAQQNQVEQAWAFFFAMWCCAASLDPIFAGACGWVWLLARVCYGYIYRVNPSRNRLMLTTVPAYSAQVLCCAGILTAILPTSLPTAAAISACVVCAFVVYGWFGYRTWFRDFVQQEKDDLFDEAAYESEA
mmetsp:Transcript_59347/g.105512  ORF Transcript_59347/g.105512 Transcript_59347/m.105512 type:complete len:194 (+) Transcript_59347:69-650(+)